jgi:hypothetical protein
MKMEKVRCAETSVQKYHSLLRNIPEESADVYYNVAES